MTKFIFGLSLMVVVLTIGCFTFPLDESSTSTRSSLVTRPLLSDREKTDLMKSKPLTNEMRLETSTFSFSPMSSKLVDRKTSKFGESESSELFTSTTIRPFQTRGFPDSSLTSAEATTKLNQHGGGLSMDDESDTDKREVLELTTSYMPSFTSTSSAVAPNYYKSESSTQKSVVPLVELSTQKYVGPLVESSEEGSEPIKMKKPIKSKLELTTELNFPTAQLDQKLGDLISNVPSGIMSLEENVIAVTSIPDKLELTTIKNLKEQSSSEEDLKPTLKPKLERKPVESQESLNQGKESTFTEAPQPDN